MDFGQWIADRWKSKSVKSAIDCIYRFYILVKCLHMRRANIVGHDNFQFFIIVETKVSGSRWLRNTPLISQSVSALQNLDTKEWLLRLETFQTFDQSDVKTKRERRQRQKRTPNDVWLKTVMNKHGANDFWLQTVIIKCTGPNHPWLKTVENKCREPNDLLCTVVIDITQPCIIS